MSEEALIEHFRALYEEATLLDERFSDWSTAYSRGFYYGILVMLLKGENIDDISINL